MRSCREPSGADLNHPIISSLDIFRLLGPLSALGSPHAAKRFIGLAIGVRTKSRALRSHSHPPSRLCPLNMGLFLRMGPKSGNWDLCCGSGAALDTPREWDPSWELETQL